ncbi:hypothetical protein NDU88_002137 [Pleurodeles waltl]|uniref:Uncharacterized protein n=1 Tax=Pleurodeles waltl TaxID=8319 RepID=A0AAV7WKD8_PLEWA|nr:hypothetical protein NDU88_002137 [Pleurodeles waltl]
MFPLRESSACHLRGDRRERGVLETQKEVEDGLTVESERMAGATENKEDNTKSALPCPLFDEVTDLHIGDEVAVASTSFWLS